MRNVGILEKNHQEIRFTVLGGTEVRMTILDCLVNPSSKKNKGEKRGELKFFSEIAGTRYFSF